MVRGSRGRRLVDLDGGAAAEKKAVLEPPCARVDEGAVVHAGGGLHGNVRRPRGLASGSAQGAALATLREILHGVGARVRRVKPAVRPVVMVAMGIDHGAVRQAEPAKLETALPAPHVLATVAALLHHDATARATLEASGVAGTLELPEGEAAMLHAALAQFADHVENRGCARLLRRRGGDRRAGACAARQRPPLREARPRPGGCRCRPRRRIPPSGWRHLPRSRTLGQAFEPGVFLGQRRLACLAVVLRAAAVHAEGVAA
mmetsp:Transcript_41282/g.82124  ORF Transcript_41282/g.82124 Transcript_41282/m.82124 type:complete len:261 (+) Transcript_41282:201-983(+)